MGWTINLQPIRYERADDLLLTLGRATYVAGRFEQKCKTLLRFVRLSDTLSTDPVMDLEAAISIQPKDSMLNGTLQALTELLKVDQTRIDLLVHARKGRNFLAHEGSDFDIHSPFLTPLTEHLDRLHSAVRSIASGDNVVSAWICRMEGSPLGLPKMIIVAYEDTLVRWVLDPVWDMLSNPDVDTSVIGDGRIHESKELFRRAYPEAEFR